MRCVTFLTIFCCGAAGVTLLGTPMPSDPGPKPAEAHDPSDQNVDASFYGTIVDQDSQPLRDVQVDLGLVKFVGMEGGAVHLVRQTDEHGRFSIVGERGYAVEIARTLKQGYL